MRGTPTAAHCSVLQKWSKRAVRSAYTCLYVHKCHPLKLPLPTFATVSSTHPTSRPHPLPIYFGLPGRLPLFVRCTSSDPAQPGACSVSGFKPDKRDVRDPFNSDELGQFNNCFFPGDKVERFFFTVRKALLSLKIPRRSKVSAALLPFHNLHCC